MNTMSTFWYLSCRKRTIQKKQLLAIYFLLVVMEPLTSMNLFHYHSMDPNVNRGESQECLEACGDALPADDQATVFLLKPSKCPLGLEPWDHLCDGPTTIFLGLPDALRDLCPDAPLPELLAQRFRIIAFIRGDHFQTFSGTAPFARADLDGIKQRQHLCPLVPIGRRGAVGQGHADALPETVDQNPFYFPSPGAAPP